MAPDPDMIGEQKKTAQEKGRGGTNRKKKTEGRTSKTRRCKLKEGLGKIDKSRQEAEREETGMQTGGKQPMYEPGEPKTVTGKAKET